eukprot:gene27169-32823_t
MNFLSSFTSVLTRPIEGAKPVVKSPYIELGSTISLKSIDGEVFQCSALITDPNTEKSFIKEKHLLAVTSKQIVELQPSTLFSGTATVSEVHELAALGKLKFRKPGKTEGILILEYKAGQISRFLMPDPSPCVNLIKKHMRDLGLNSNLSKSKRSLRYIATANELMDRASEIETNFSREVSILHSQTKENGNSAVPAEDKDNLQDLDSRSYGKRQASGQYEKCLHLIQEMMSLLRQAVEMYSEANDTYYETCVNKIRNFLVRDDVVYILEWTYKRHKQGEQGSGDGGIGLDESVLVLEEYKDCLSSPTSPTSPPSPVKAPPFLQEYDSLKKNKSPARTAASANVDPFAYIAQAVTYDSGEGEEDLHVLTPKSAAKGRLVGSGRKKSKGGDSAEDELEAFLKELDTEFDVMVKSFVVDKGDGAAQGEGGSATGRAAFNKAGSVEIEGMEMLDQLLRDK